jgi:hypothetical protein
MIKKFISAFFIVLGFALFSQAPVIEGTYLPVKNTKIRQVWDITPGSMSVPSVGTNMVWDYRFSNNQFLNVVDTFDFGFYDPQSTPYSQYFPGATHASFVRTPFNNISDSLYYYWEINQDGLFNLGGFNIQETYDSTIININKEFYAPNTINYGDSYSDTLYSIGYANNYQGYKARIKARKYKTYSYIGYGTLLLPNGNYNNVALITETNAMLDSIFVDFANNGNYVHVGNQTSSALVYIFLRNNTFGSNYLMYLSANTQNTEVSYGWYTLPTDFGSISGTVYANNAETSVVTDGEMYLYRENSNFSKNDILARTKLKTNGTFQFDSIPYGEYRIAVRPNLSLFPNSKITYYGDTTNWIDAQSIITTTTTSSGHKIHLQYHPVPAGSSTITGTIGQDWAFNKGNGIMASNPVPGIGIVVKKHPNNVTARVLVTDSLGQYDIGNLEDGAYTVFVDIPGLHMTGTYNFTIANSAVVNSLDFTVGKDSIHPINLTVIGVNELTASKNTLNIKAYPNPFSEQFSLEAEGESMAGDKLEVYNVIGQAVKVDYGREQKAGKTIYHVSLQEANLATGVYVIKLTHQQKQANLRLIKH